MPTGGTPFYRAPPAVWRISHTLPAERRERLLHSPEFDQIVANLMGSIRQVSIFREKARKQGQWRRVVATISLDPVHVDSYHCGASGYRAQFLHSPELGEHANAITVRALLPLVLKAVGDSRPGGADPTWEKASLATSETKAWIRQGIWAHHASDSCIDLCVPDWVARSRHPDQDVRKRVRLGKYLPDDLRSIEVKGGWVTREAQSVAPLKPQTKRSMDLHLDGFT